MKTKLYRARDYGKGTANSLWLDYLFDMNFESNITSGRVFNRFIPRNVTMQMKLNFGPHFPVKQIYIDAAIEAAIIEMKRLIKECNGTTSP